jgi:hypothetical protein|tara:strand:+ start:79 stop:603 length:525 start_codon:yes stop_codon:yes gene_type:complete
MYFAQFPLNIYDSVGDETYKLVTHLLKRVTIRAKVKANTLFFDTYDVREGETPEMIADKLYNDSELHWIVLMVNDITDRYHQWPKNQNQFLTYINDKYTNISGTHHYEINQTSGDTTIKINIGTDNTDYPTATLITNYEYEEERQDALRKIRLLSPEYVTDFVSEFKLIMKDNG